MKNFRQILLITLLLIAMVAKSYSQQNLVLNPGFEQHTSCPTNTGEIDKATGWNSYAYSPDYFNVCGGVGLSIPDNMFGYQSPASGNAYAGFANFISNAYIPGDIREYIGGGLSSPLVVNTKYYVSFKVNLTINPSIFSTGASDKMGAMFSTVAYSNGNPAIITNNPPVYANSIVSDTLNWTKVFGSFYADSAYLYIILGNFFDNQNTDTLIMTNDTICSSYYFIDDICVSTDSAFCANYSTGINEINPNKTVSIYPNPAYDYLNLDFLTLYVDGEIKIYDEMGQELANQKINSQHTIINISNFPKGVLFLKISNENQLNYYEVIKQ